MTITSGWRSPEFQQQLLDDAVSTYGSIAAARQYVQPPERSRHVLGQAVDIGGYGADQWLIAHGSRFGLCQIYANEVWHFELATDAPGFATDEPMDKLGTTLSLPPFLENRRAEIEAGLKKL